MTIPVIVQVLLPEIIPVQENDLREQEREIIVPVQIAVVDNFLIAKNKVPNVIQI